MKQCMMSLVALLVCLSGCTSLYDRCDEQGDYIYLYTRSDMIRELRSIPAVQRVHLEDGRVMEVHMEVDEIIEQEREGALDTMGFMDGIDTAYECNTYNAKQVLDFTATLRLIELRADGHEDVVVESALAEGHYTVSSTRLDKGFVDIAVLGSNDVLESSVTYSLVDGRGESAVVTRVYVLGQGLVFREEP